MSESNTQPAGTPTTLSTDTAPCVGCGLCCDGSIYWRADAAPDEEQQLKDAGHKVIKKGERAWFVHPCRFSENGLCTIYDQERPKVCYSYRCKLLTAYQAGELGLEEARSTVKRALRLRSELVADEPAARLWKGRQRLRRDLQKSKKRPELLLKIAVLDYCLDRWFRK